MQRPLYFILFLVLIMTTGFPWTAATAQGTTAPAAPPDVSSAELEALAKDLDDPAARERLVKQLRTLAKLKAGEAPPENPVQGATVDLLQAVTGKAQALSADLVELARSLNAYPQLLAWGQQQLTDPQARRAWADIVLNLSLIVGAGYLSLGLLRRLLRRPRRALSQNGRQSAPARWLLRLGLLLLELVPVAGFAAAYLVSGLVDAREQTRLAALTWINAAVVSRLALALGRVVFAPAAPALRLAPVSDETAHYADIWLRRLILVPVYGYFALQAALLLGLPRIAYAALLRLLGLGWTMLLIVLLAQNRAGVGAYLRGTPARPPGARTGVRGLRERFARIWFPPAVAYLLALYALWALGSDAGFAFLLRATVGSLGALLTGGYLLYALDRGLTRGVGVAPALQHRFPGLETRANRYIPWLALTGRWLIYALVTLALLQSWGFNVYAWLLSQPGRVLTGALVKVGLIGVVAVLLWETIDAVIANRLTAAADPAAALVYSSRLRTLLTLARSAAFTLLAVMTVMSMLTELGVSIAPLLAGAGVLGVAVGFGAQKLVQDVITGFFILFDNLIAVDDVIKVGDKSGRVEAVSMRNVRLRDADGALHAIPYSAITTVTNLSRPVS